MGDHMLIVDGTTSEWEPVLNRFPKTKPDRKVVTSCCNRRHPAKDADIQTFTPNPFDENGEITTGAYYDPTHHFRCHKGTGCDVNEGMKRTAHLREGWYEPLC